VQILAAMTRCCEASKQTANVLNQLPNSQQQKPSGPCKTPGWPKKDALALRRLHRDLRRRGKTSTIDAQGAFTIICISGKR